MENVTSETSNPFGMRAGGPAVYGYGDANADFHVIGDHPGVHGGVTTGVPFTENGAGERLQRVLAEVGLLAETGDRPVVDDTFLSYAHCGVPEREPTDSDYADFERFLDAELRAINAHILLPVGDRPLRYTLQEHTSMAYRLPDSAAELHAQDIRGRGFMVLPVKEPTEWDDGDEEALVDTLTAILESDYRQTKGIPTLVG
ncbi:uracil-DNA glycosylase family protein [Natronomonas sp. EA1]|uniref:uracil-DNA glycosylase family protein n=1 Tax=Natronomonas sp. EA1 TaxID=3421655 RepID=UPI003EB8E62C